jgi:hypothetical protein
MIKNKTLLVDFHSELRKDDTENQTFGCRHTNPDICSSNMIPNICAFASKDCICKRPSRAWKNQYDLLKG